MKVGFSRCGLYAVAGATALALALPGLPAAAAHRPAGTPKWLVVKGHTAMLTLIAGYKGGFDFNGDSNGKMVISVPVGYTVNVTFSNRGGAPHSAVFTLYNKRTSTGSFPLAFRGAGSPNSMSGIGQGKTQRFSFKATKAGKYALVCAVPGHAVAGMWDVFQVTRGGKPTIKV